MKKFKILIVFLCFVSSIDAQNVIMYRKDSVGGSGANLFVTVPYLNTHSATVDTLTKIATKQNLTTKVDKVTGKGLSTNDFTNTLKTKYDSVSLKLDNPTYNQTFNDTLYFNKIFRHYAYDTLSASFTFKIKATGKIPGYTEQLTRVGNGSATIDTTGNFAKKIILVGSFDNTIGKKNNITCMYDGQYIWISILQPNE